MCSSPALFYICSIILSSGLGFFFVKRKKIYAKQKSDSTSDASLCMHIEMYIHMRWKQNVILGSISYPHKSVISTGRHGGH